MYPSLFITALKEAMLFEAAFARFWGHKTYAWLCEDPERTFPYRGSPYRKAFVRIKAREACSADLGRIAA